MITFQRLRSSVLFLLLAFVTLARPVGAQVKSGAAADAAAGASGQVGSSLNTNSGAITSIGLSGAVPPALLAPSPSLAPSGAPATLAPGVVVPVAPKPVVVGNMLLGAPEAGSLPLSAPGSRASSLGLPRSTLSEAEASPESIIGKKPEAGSSWKEDAEESASYLGRMWDGAHALTAALSPWRLNGRVEETKTHLEEALQDPVLRRRLAAIISASLEEEDGSRVAEQKILRRLDASVRHQKVGFNSILTYASMRPETMAVGHGSAIASISGVDVHFNVRSEEARKAPPRVLAGVLLHELVHTTFRLGEVTAHLAERAYYNWLDRRLAVEDQEEQLWLRRMIRFPLRERREYLESVYGESKLSRFPDDSRDGYKVKLRRARRVRQVLGGLAAQPRIGDSRRRWVEAALPDDKDREYLRSLLEDASLRFSAEQDALQGTAVALDEEIKLLKAISSPRRPVSAAPSGS